MGKYFLPAALAAAFAVAGCNNMTPQERDTLGGTASGAGGNAGVGGVVGGIPGHV